MKSPWRRAFRIRRRRILLAPITVVVNEDGTNTTVVKPKPLLTGIPQIDYVLDPNLPRELNGYNLSDYPFFNSVPKDIDFACDGLHDGFYASVPHKCQLYHHCLFGTRYDFLCANYTAFDQKTFICHFVSEVDCKNSPNHYKRRRRPVYEYYYDDEEEAYDEEYYDDELEPPPRKANRRQQRPGGRREEPTTTTTTTTTTTPAPPTGDGPLTRAPHSVYVPRALPKIKRPVPINEKSKYDYTTKPGSGVAAPTSNPKDDADDEEYYYDDEEYEDPLPPKRKEMGKNGRRRTQYPERKRPIRYEDEYEDEEEERPRMRKGNRNKDDDYNRPRNRGFQGKTKKGLRDEDDPIPSERPGYITSPRESSRKRYQEGSRSERRRPDRRPSKGYDYYDEDLEEDDISRFSSEEKQRPRPKADKPRPRPKKPTTTTTTTTAATTTTTTTTTTSTTTTPPPPKAPSPQLPQQYDDEEEYEEYEEYEDEPIEEKPAPPSREVPSTTQAPHRFSTTAHRTQRPSSSTTADPPSSYSRGTSAITYRPRKPEFRRQPSSDELFSSHVGTPTGFRREEEANAKSTPESTVNKPLDEGVQRPRGPEFPSRKPYSVQNGPGDEQQPIRRPFKQDSFQASVDTKLPPARQDYLSSPIDTKPTGEAQGFFIRKPFKTQLTLLSNSKYNQDSPQTRTDFLSVTSQQSPASQEGLSYRKQDQFDSKGPDNRNYQNSRPQDNKQRFEYSIAPPQITQAPPLPPSSQQVYRRPYGPSAPDGLKRQNDDSQYRRRPDPFAPTGEDPLRSSFPPSAESDTSSKEEQDYKKPQRNNYSPSGPEIYRRPDGSPLKATTSRRSKPNDKEKSLQELAYPSRRTASTPEPVTQPGPNYRNPFLNSRPVAEEQDYYKNVKEPSVEFTAPGPQDGSTQRPLSAYDIGDEYDVTLNDALQPSTLNPTVQYSRVKTRGYQSAVTHPSYRSLLIPAASHNYYTKAAPAAPTAADQGEYETAALPASRYSQPRYKQRRNNECIRKRIFEAVSRPLAKMVVSHDITLPTEEELTVQEVNVSSSVLRSAAFHLGKYCEFAND
ncbi:unnamed protein product, partial [Nesidiocoris tenuis]